MDITKYIGLNSKNVSKLSNPFYLVLALLVLQTSISVLLMRFTRTHDDGQPYSVTSMVFITECLKYVICVLLFFRNLI